MTYRNDNDALRARVARLEGELAQAEEKIARLEGTSSSAPAALEDTKESRFLGAPLALTMSRELPFEIDDKGYEALAALGTQRIGVQSSQVGRTLRVGDVLTVVSQDGKTEIRLHASWAGISRTPIVTGVLSGGFSAMAAVAFLHDLAHLSGPMLAANFAWIAPSVGLGLGALVRSRVRRTARANEARYRGLFETAIELAARHAVKPRVRVEPSAGEAEEEAEVDAASGDRAQRTRA